MDKYISLFRHKGESITGDISPGYCALEDDIIRQVNARLPAIRIVLLIRDPLQRLWSHISMWHRNGKFDEALLEDPAKLRLYLKRAEMANERSSPTEAANHWRRHGPSLQLRHFFFDDIVERPEQARSEILLFLGADPGRGGAVEASYNKKSEAPKLVLTDSVKGVLLEHCAGEIRACAKEFGGRAEAWASAYGL